MASDGLIKKAKIGTFRICQRVRSTTKHLKAVGEVRHGFATGHIWECIDIANCDTSAHLKISNPLCTKKSVISNALIRGRFTDYKIFN